MSDNLFFICCILIILLTSGCWILTLRVNGLADRVKAIEESAKDKAA
jgi:hypothetical protein